ncbi:hypothetical protein H9660_13780 [Clostridium sp. Sa3CUN1]|uniref:SHSP domain-containing protein n=1 Tax=Clostridium gallinarum TaxID=2762246 RepID=A0ABR8Q763_9CLOT|nr:hypothetical protein [Clostridium gallinarum]MBD7916215.1 hypothetical protein [Clostridium gallinarum]
MKNNIIEINKDEKNINPIIKVIDKDSFYDIYIYFKNLTKDEIVLKYINNFLILNLSLKNSKNDLLKFKRILYLNKINIDTIQNSVQANFIYLKVFKT